MHFLKHTYHFFPSVFICVCGNDHQDVGMMLLFTAGFGPMWKSLSLLIKASALTGVTLLQTCESSVEAVLNKEGFDE